MKSVLTRVLFPAILLGLMFALSACKQQPENPPAAPSSQAPSVG